MKQRRYKCMLLPVICLSALWGCSGQMVQEPQENFVIGVVTKSENSEYWLSVRSGMEKAAREQHVEVLILSPDFETEDQVQSKMIEDLIKRGVDALAISPIDSHGCQERLDQAGEAGIPVYAYDTPIAGAAVPYIGIDNEAVGYALGEKLAEQMGGSGTIAIISGSRRQASHEQRIAGFERYMKNEPGIRIVEVKSGYSNLRVSEQEMEELLKEYPNLDGIMTTSAVTALGIAEATEATGIAIASIDDQEDAVRAVQEGRISVLGAQSGYDIGYETIKYIVADKDGISQQDEQILPVQILTLENVKEYQNLKK